MATYTKLSGFHHAELVHDKMRLFLPLRWDTQFTYTFENFFHPYVGELIEQLNKKSLAGLLDPKYHEGLTKDFFGAFYAALTSATVQIESFPKEIDLRDGGPYAGYNWELLFHVPLTIAVHLSKNQRFAEAQRWFHYIFDPTCNDTTIAPPQRFWKFLRFRRNTDVQQIGDLLALLSKPDIECTPAEIALKTGITNGYEAIKRKPFQPHAVARTRTLAYQYCVVMKYLDNLIAWGDSLFLQDTVESINEATQRYVLAANLLGPRPQQLPVRGAVRPKTFAQLKAAGMDPMGNALVELEGMFPWNLTLPRSSGGATSDPSGPLFGIGRTLYFCVPRNDKLLTYWDTVADRLFKIRHCMNIAGVVRQLALFEPPIDPGMLVKAAAAGIDIGSVIAGLNQPIGPVRSLLLIQKALELSAEVRSLGSALLSAIEKGDGEHLVRLRQGHEMKIQQATQEVRFLQWQQARAATESLLRSRASTIERYRYHQRLLGLTPDAGAAPDMLPLDRRALSEENFDEAYGALVGQYEETVTPQAYPTLKLSGDASPANQSGASGAGRLHLSSNEDADLNVHGPAAREARGSAMTSDTISGVLALIPDMGIDLHFWGLGGHAKLFGGTLLAGAGRFYSSVKSASAANEEGQALCASKTASYERRADDWVLQSNLAARELVQIGRQIIASLIAEQVAHHDYSNVQSQIKQTQEVDDFLRRKFTSEELYLWMQGEISRLYYEYYRFAFDTARKAERSMKQEIMRPELDGTDYVKFSYWDGGRKGLLSGEALHLDIKRMEMAYHENNKRELELTRHVSLRQLDPMALLTLKATGECEVAIPEWLYDRDCPGHHMRRIKSVAISMPAVVGPFTSVNCALSLLRSTVRRSPLLKDGDYFRHPGDDDRFVDYLGSVQSIVTSGGNNDSGLFEVNLRDERLLPFEGAGAVSAWRLELPADFRPFDYMTISDVILHIRYTARQGGDVLGNQAMVELREMVSTAGKSGLALLFSLRHDFPTEWAAFVHGTPELAAQLRKDHFPYLAQGKELSIDALELYSPISGKLEKRGVPVPAALADDLNDPGKGSSVLALGPDPKVLKREAAQVFLVLRYSLS